VVHQLPLNMTLRPGSSFTNLIPGPNAEAVARVALAAEGEGRDATLFVWGEGGTGKSHLLQAVCRRAQERGVPCAYLSMAEVVSLSPAMLEERETATLICLDEAEHLVGRREWQHAIFALYERQRAQDGVLIAAGRASPNALGLAMPELVTRFGSGPVYHLHSLSDDDKVAALQLRARQRGLDLPDEVGRYVLSRYARDTHALFALLERIDQLSLAHQRRITIPLIRSLD
jgi:DnaA family protein